MKNTLTELKNLYLELNDLKFRLKIIYFFEKFNLNINKLILIYII
jgi:hypothetical protein